MSLATVQLMSIMNEAKIVHGRELFPYIPPKLLDQIAKGLVQAGMYKTEDDAMAVLKSDEGRISISTNDVFNSIIQREIEKYDKDLDLMILRSETIVETYNKVVEMKFDEAAKTYMQKMAKFSEELEEDPTTAIDKPLISSLEVAAGTLAQYAAIPGIDLDELKRTIIQGSVYTSDDPEKIKRHIQMRINYNKTIIRMFQEMLKQNYQILGFSKDEALLLSQQLASDNQEERSESVKTIKAAILANKKKFDRGNGFIDLRSVGAGVIFGTTKETGLDKFMSIDRMIQTSMRYDCILFGHGASGSRRSQEYFEKLENEKDKKIKAEREFREKYSNQARDVRESMKDLYNRIEEKYPQYMKYFKSDYGKINKQINIEVNRLQERTKKMSEFIDVLFKRQDDLFQQNLPADEFEKKFSKIEKLIDEISEKRERTYKVVDSYISKLVQREMDRAKIDNKTLSDRYFEKKHSGTSPEMVKLGQEIEKMDEQIDQYSREYQKIIIEDKESGAEFRWTIQPVSTEKAGPFTDMNDLVRQAIKEGYKKIMIVSCNPGHHELDPDIKKTKGVIINHSMNTLLAESVMSPMDGYDYDPFDPLDEASQTLFETEQHLVKVCNESGIDYWDDDILNEAATMFEQDVERLNEEGIGRKVWTTVKELIKKAIGFLAKIIKGIISFFRGIIEKIKAFFAKIFGKSSKIEKPLRKEFKTAFIIVEAASVRNVSIKNWDDLQKSALESCDKIADKINKLERQQTELLKKTEQFAEQQERKVPQNENVYTSYTIEMLKRLAGI